jgi:hypothetical protein
MNDLPDRGKLAQGTQHLLRLQQGSSVVARRWRTRLGPFHPDRVPGSKRHVGRRCVDVAGRPLERHATCPPCEPQLHYEARAHIRPQTTAKKTKPLNPPPVGKAGFEVWILTKGGLVSVHHCRLYCTVVHAHLVRGGMLTLGCVRV